MAHHPAQHHTTANEHPQIVSDYLLKEQSRGRMLGPFADSQDHPSLHINRIGVIPKGRNTGKWRLITDLSYPKGHSVEDSIETSLCSLPYFTVGQVAGLVARSGQGTLLAKLTSNPPTV